MSQTNLIWLVIVLVLVTANIPFFTRHFLGFVKIAEGKTLFLRLLELLILYFLSGFVALGLEKHAGQIAPQGWEFYAITVAVFVTFAFPGFVYRYLYQKD
jgi:hypothetical protein